MPRVDRVFPADGGIQSLAPLGDILTVGTVADPS